MPVESSRRSIEIRPVGHVHQRTLEALTEPLETRFRLPVRIGGPYPLHSAWLDRSRDQYRADRVLDALISAGTDRARWTLGVVDYDLFAPGLRFVFGQATVDGCCAVIGIARLRPEFHGKIRDPALFHRRVLTEAVHELGHVAGRSHCPDPRCVMHFSNTLAETDVKGTEFCPRCTL